MFDEFETGKIVPLIKQWSTVKPTEPGRYETRWHDRMGFDKTHIVTVKHRGRGLSVIPDPPYDTVYPKSDIGDDELEWFKL